MTEPDYRVKSLKRPYRNKIGHRHDRWVVDYRDEEDEQWYTKFDGDFNKSQAKEKIREFAEPGERIRINDMDGNELRVEEVSE